MRTARPTRSRCVPAAQGGDERRRHPGGLGADREGAADDLLRQVRQPHPLGGGAGLGARPVGPHGGHPALVRVRAHRARQQPHRGDAVDQRVVGLGVERHPAVAQPLDQVRLPQRPLAGEQGAVQPRHQVEELADPPGLRQGAVPHVVVDVEELVGLPHELPRRAQRPARVLEEQRRDLVDRVVGAHRLVHLAHVVATRALRLLEQLQPADVHRLGAVLGEQEADRGRIDGRDHRSILAGGSVRHKWISTRSLRDLLDHRKIGTVAGCPIDHRQWVHGAAPVRPALGPRADLALRPGRPGCARRPGRSRSARWPPGSPGSWPPT